MNDAVAAPALARARALVDAAAADTMDWPAAPHDAVALGWALKQVCYDSWTRQPGQAERAARLLEALARVHPQPPLDALARWTRGIAELGRGRMHDALVALDAASAAFDSAGDAAHAAQTQVPKLMALSVLGRHDDALACAQATLARFIASGDERSAGKIELNLGTMLFRQDRHADACRQYRSAAVRFARVQDVEHSVMADIGLANALTWQFDFDEALRINERARMRADTRGYTVLSAQARAAIGQLELNRGQPQRALPVLAEACRLLEGAGSLPQQLAEAEIALAEAYLAVNLLPEALALFTRCVDHCAEHGIAADRARALLHRAEARARLGDAAAARADLADAQRLFMAQDNAASAALAGLHASALALHGGEADPDTARRGALAAAAAFGELGLPGWRCEAEVLVAEAQAAAGDTTAAAAGFAQALHSPGATGRTGWRCRVGLAALARAAGHSSAARDHLEAALARLDAQRAALPGDEFRTAFGADKAAAFDQLVAMAWTALQAQPASHDAAEALWSAMERARAQALALGIGHADTAAPGAPAGTEAQRTRLTWTREQAALALAEGDAEAASAWDTQARGLETALLEAHRRAQLATPAGGARPATAAGPPRLQQLQAALRPGEAWVKYHLQPPGAGAVWLAGVVTRERITWCHGSAAGLAERLASLRFQLDTMRQPAPGLQVHAGQLAERTRRHLQALHTLCWAPLAEALGDCTTVYVAAHRELHYVPFAALHDGTAWLVERHATVCVPSARVWLDGQQRATTANDTTTHPGHLLALGVGGPALPHVAAEVQAVARHFGAQATTLLDAAATRAALHAHAAAADVLHLACHAHFRADSPYFSALHLADGELTLRDAAALRLRARLVTLSACETGLSRVAPGDELVGLVRGFLLAGAPTVLATLWTVDDASTAALMHDFYAQLCAGATPAAALRAAQCRRATAGAHPFFWAAFMLHGQG